MNKSLNIKWSKETFPIELSEEQTISDLKVKIASLKGIGVDRQKLLYKAKVLENSFPLSYLEDGVTITLLGTAIVEVSENSNTVQFLEDLSEKEKADLLRKKGEELKFGLVNLGNTCYFNSTVQCLGSVVELREALKSLALNTQSYNPQIDEELFSKVLGATYAQLDSSASEVTPKDLVYVLRTLNPLFAEKTKGVFNQQDAEECWNYVVNTIKKYLPSVEKEGKFSDNLFDELFGIEQNVQMKNVEFPEECTLNTELSYKLVSYIDQNTTELVQGIKSGTQEQIEKLSNITQENAQFIKTTEINRLPPYLNIQFLRFFWKAQVSSASSVGGKAKILKAVAFGTTIDLYELCSEETKKLLDVGRKSEEIILKNDPLYKVGALNYFKDKEATESLVPTGRYRLIAVLTHKGRSSDSGHYIGWTYNNADKWTKFDDETVSIVKDQAILETKGGGDNDIAYITVWKRLEVPFSITE